MTTDALCMADISHDINGIQMRDLEKLQYGGLSINI